MFSLQYSMNNSLIEYWFIVFVESLKDDRSTQNSRIKGLNSKMIISKITKNYFMVYANLVTKDTLTKDISFLSNLVCAAMLHPIFYMFYVKKISFK